MPQLPIDVKEVLKTATDIDEARKMPVSVAVVVDPTAPADLASFAANAFVATEETARVVVGGYEACSQLPSPCDLAVLVAGLSEQTGALAHRLHEAGTPVITLTTMPEIVVALARQSGYPLLENDVIAPRVPARAATAQADDSPEEPYPLSPERADDMSQAMGKWIVEVFREKRLAFALCFPFVRRPLAVEYVNATAVQNAGIGLVVIIPGADMPVMTANQAKMLLQIAAAYGQKLGAQRLKELAGVVGGAFALRAAARQVAAAVPGFGWAVKAGVGYAGTIAMGYAAITYFEQVAAGLSVADAAQAARVEASRIAEQVQGSQSPQDALAIVAKSLAGRVVQGTRTAAAKAYPAAKSAIADVADAVGSTPADLGKQAIATLLSVRNNR